jgi:hypothetical protein
MIECRVMLIGGPDLKTTYDAAGGIVFDAVSRGCQTAMPRSGSWSHKLVKLSQIPSRHIWRRQICRSQAIVVYTRQLQPYNGRVREHLHPCGTAQLI